MSANLKNNQGDQQSRNERHTFVLVHGGWCGGWLWRYVAPALRERGHVVTTPTLTGLGERRHSENRTATLSTHTSLAGRRRAMLLVQAELEEITSALEAFKSDVAAGASVGAMPGRLIKD